MPIERDDAGLDEKTDVRTPLPDGPTSESETTHLLRALTRTCEFEFGHLRLSFKKMHERTADWVAGLNDRVDGHERRLDHGEKRDIEHETRMSRIESEFATVKRDIIAQLEDIEARIAAMKP